MAILKPGFTPGFRGRQAPAALSRRAFYLAAEHGRDSARLLDPEGREISPAQAIELMGGVGAEYHEVILAPSASECRALRARNAQDPDREVREAGLRIVRTLAHGRPFLLAVHEQDGRFHFHLVISGRMPEHTLGRHGQAQKQWDRELHGDEPRIQDWEAHRRFKALRVQLQDLIAEQRNLAKAQREALLAAPPSSRESMAQAFRLRRTESVERRFDLEVAALHARYEARGSLGSPRHQAELEQAEHRRTAALRQVNRSWNPRAATRRSLVREVPPSGVTRVLGTARSLAARGVDQALEAMGVPTPLQQGTRIAMTLAAGAVQVALLSRSREAWTPAAPTGRIPVNSTSRLTLGAQVGISAVQQVAGRHLPGVQVLGSLAHTGVQAAADLALCPPHLLVTLPKGAANLVLDLTQGTGNPLPKEAQQAFQIAGLVPGVGLGAQVLQRAAELAYPLSQKQTRSLEVER